MEFRDLLKKDLDKNTIGIGSRVGGLLTLDINKYSSIIITGETGSGKSVLLNQIILQMINKYTSDDLRLVLIDTTGVELNDYKNTTYRLLTAYNDVNKAQEVIAKVIEEIDRRKELLLEYNMPNIDEYNSKFERKIPRLIVAIDDNRSLLGIEDVDNMLKKIIKYLDNLNILFILSTNNTYNDFFMEDGNLLSKVLITFDTTSEEEASNTDIPFSHDLLKGKFIIYKDGNYEEYQNMDFDNNIIKEIID